MIAYNHADLDNRIVQEQADEASVKSCITREEDSQIRGAYPANFYTPNIYIRIGLFLLTVVIALFSLGLFAMITDPGNHGIGILLIFSGAVCYGVLEYLVYSKKHFRSGVDDALLWIAIGLIATGIIWYTDPIVLTQYVVIFILAFYGSLRFADHVMSLVTYAALLGFVFNVAMKLGTSGKTIIPFLVMAVSVAAYFFSTSLHSKERLRHYHSCLTLIRAASLISFYLAGNYFVVRELSINMLGLSLQPGASIPLGWLFWILTVCIPFFYIYRGVQKKDTIFLWVGLGLIAATVFTIRNYYHILPLEWALVIGGLLLIAVSYALIRYLKIPRHGFSSQETDDSHLLATLHIESLVIAETFAAPAASPAPNDFQFGGGSGGGGGAGGQY
jgi:hypothetical protein